MVLLVVSSLVMEIWTGCPFKGVSRKGRLLNYNGNKAIITTRIDSSESSFTSSCIDSSADSSMESSAESSADSSANSDKSADRSADSITFHVIAGYLLQTRTNHSLSHYLSQRIING